MGYRTEIYERAFQMKRDGVKAIKEAYERQLDALRESQPEFAENEAALASAGPAAAVAALSGDGDSLNRLRALCDELSRENEKILRLAGVTKPTVSCPLCEDTGYQSGAVCDCVKRIARQLVADELSASLPVGDCSFDNFRLDYYADVPTSDGSVPRKRAAAILALCRDFVENFPQNGRSLLFMGGAGLGKTHLSLAVVSGVSAKGYEVVYGSAQNLFSAAEKEHFSFTGDSEKEDALLGCDLLVIDDLGTEFLSAYTSSLFYNVINTRLLNKKSTIVNTNLSFDELEKRYTARITSRFIGSYDMKKFVGSDIRQQKAFEK